jgi:DNA-binding NarL/FixJ family response regulator
MNKTSLAICTHDDPLWERLQPLSERWLIQRVTTADEIKGFQGLLLVDADTPGLPALTDTAWPNCLQNAQAIFAASMPDEDLGLAALNAGFSGFTPLYAPISRMIQVVEVVEQGNLWVGRSLLTRLLKSTSTVLSDKQHPPVTAERWAEGLTEREQEVAKRAAIGESNQEIAEACGITERTVKAHLSAAFEKLGVHDRLHLSLKVHGVR